MRNFEFRWKNFRAFEDTGWIKVRPITVLLGANATGKTSLIAPLLAMKQSLKSTDPSLHLMTKGELFNAGEYKDLICDHDVNRDLSFAIRFTPIKQKSNKQLKPIGAYAPNELSLVFSITNNSSTPLLKRYVVRDEYGRMLLDRTLLKTGKYSLKRFKLSTKEHSSTKEHNFMRDAIKEVAPEQFLFTQESVLRLFYKKRREKRREGKRIAHKTEFSKREDLYLSIASFVSAVTISLLSKIAYIGPLREYPRRLYELAGEHPLNVGRRGKSAPEIIFRHRKDKLLSEINNWISNFELGSILEPNKLTHDAFNITLRRTKTSPSINFADTGFGLSQILPLIVQGFFAKADSLIIAEQPEIHLNPKLQSLLADLFCDVASRDVGVLVETHSEYLVLRLRKLIAEGKIKSTDVALYYIEKQQDRSIIRNIPVQPNGHINSDDWPMGFFGESLRDAFALATAQAKIVKNVK